MRRLWDIFSAQARVFSANYAEKMSFDLRKRENSQLIAIDEAHRADQRSVIRRL
jgi:hypothetical protein